MREAIVLAGGFGTRLREVVPDLPKPMAPVAGRPFLDRFLRELSLKGFTRVVLSLGFRADAIIAHFGGQFAGMEIVYAVEDSPLGTGGAVRLGLSHCQSDHVFVFNGDTFLDLEVDSLEVLWQQDRNTIMVAREVEDTSRYGRLLFEGGRAIGFAEKGVNGVGLINAGCYVLGVEQLDAWPLNTPFSFEADYLAQAVGTGSVSVFETSGLFIDIGVPEDYLRAQTILLNRV